MTNRRSRLISVLATSLVGAGLLSTMAYAGDTGFDPKREAAVPDEMLEFVNINPAIRMAAAFGDRSRGAHGSFGKFPASFSTPMHTHSGAYHGVVIAGEMTNPFAGEKNPPRMGPGSYWYVPAESVHATACVSATPCEFYFHADAAFDFQEVVAGK